MAKVEASVEIPAALAEVWDLYFDRDRWPAWVDGFAAVVSAAGYPKPGGELVWRSTAAGRGQVGQQVGRNRRLWRAHHAGLRAVRISAGMSKASLPLAARNGASAVSDSSRSRANCASSSRPPSVQAQARSVATRAAMDPKRTSSWRRIT